MQRITATLVIWSALSVLGTTPLRAQDERSDPPKSVAFWVEGGLGVGGSAEVEDGGALLLAANVRKDRLALQARLGGAVEILGDGTADFALLAGFTPGSAGSTRWSVLGGVSLVEAVQSCLFCDTTSETTVGLAWSASAQLWAGSPIGLGITGFGSVNSIDTYAGLVLSVRLGSVQ